MHSSENVLLDWHNVHCSPTTTSIEPLTVGFTKNVDDLDFGDDVKLRNSGSRRLPQAVPNPYSNSESIGLPAYATVRRALVNSIKTPDKCETKTLHTVCEFCRAGVGSRSDFTTIETNRQQNDEQNQFQHHKRAVK